MRSLLKLENSCRVAESPDFSTLYKTAPCGLFSLNSANKFTQTNATFAAWLGHTPDVLINKSIHDVISFGGKLAFETHIFPVLQMKGEIAELAVDFVDANGRRVPVILNASRDVSEENSAGMVHFAVFRAAHRRAYERTLVAAQKTVQGQYETEREVALLREQFIAVLGHDLRNPLAALVSGLRLLRRLGEINPKQETIITELGKSLDRAQKLIDDLMDFAQGRLGSGLEVNRRQTDDLETAIRQVIDEVRRIEPDVTIVTRIDTPEPVYADPDRIAQLTSNLLSNAVSHGDKSRAISVDAKIIGSEFMLSVENSGKPIPVETQYHLFKPFFRGMAENKPDGLGLGLFIVNEIAKAHDGTMDIKSDNDSTRFTLKIPVKMP